MFCCIIGHFLIKLRCNDIEISGYVSLINTENLRGHLAGVETEKLRKIKKETETETADCLFSTAELKLPFPLSRSFRKELKNLKIKI